MDERRAAERDEARSVRVVQFAFLPVLLLVFGLKLARDGFNPGYVWGLVVAVPIGAVALGQYYAYRRVLKRLESREAMSEHITSQPRWMRSMWLWVEYVMARNQARGTYGGEPPWEFKDEARVLAQDLNRRTLATQRQLISGVAVVTLASVVAAFFLPNAWFVPAVPLLFGAYTVIVFRGPADQRTLARRIESTRDLPTEERWQGLMTIASEQLAREAAPHS